MKLRYTLLLLFTSAFSCYAQTGSIIAANITLVHGTVAHSANNIRSILHDKNGNYWFGADGGGLYRYNGNTLTLITDKDGLCHNQIRTIQEDTSGNIWFSTGNGICLYDGNSFRNGFANISSAGLGPSPTTWHKQPGDLWFAAGTYKGVYRYDGNSFHNYQFPGAASRSSSVNYDEFDIYCIVLKKVYT